MQFIFSPLFIGVFLATLVTLEGRPSEVVPKLQQVMSNDFEMLLILLEFVSKGEIKVEIETLKNVKDGKKLEVLHLA